ncbi:assimilatory nitrate reductase catalytic subunit NasC [Priestia filamentosa]|uniref:assimilatory nitrate reductase catalytic subunit NasC n=1 Tax=Priestia filamentosa TaxID=1402861 RepID=UPI000E73E538|nr:molybdopterin oxidoreductase family protein [Priestia filamentosa]RJS65545.1 nitrite reductase [Priestia filamentosa]
MTEMLLKYFREKQEKVQSERVYDAQCPYCSMQCKMQLVEQSIVTRTKHMTIAQDNPTSHGRICIKGMNAHQHALHSERVTSPLLKVGGEFVKISWNQAFTYIGEKFRNLKEKYGKDSLSAYGGGSLTNETSYLLGKFARIALQTKYIDYNGRFCMAAAASAAKEALGIDRGFTNEISEIKEAECIILVGTNIAECQPTIMPYFEEAKENGAYIIAIDPRSTATTETAQLHLKIKPGKDALLANGLLKVLIEEDFIDEAFINDRVKGWQEVKEYVESLSLDHIAEETGIDLSLIRKAGRKFGEANASMLFTARGVEQQIDGHDAVRGFLNLLLATGNFGKKGAGYGAITGQGNGQGGREHGQKADQLPGYRSIENMEHRKYIANIWGVEESEIPNKGVSAYEMMGKIHEGEIKGMLLMGSNPIVSNPNANYVKKAIESLEFLVAVDMFVSETAQLADVILPCTSYLENKGTLTNLEGRVMLREGARPAPGEAKNDWAILRGIARELGKEQYFAFSDVEEIFDELRLASKGGSADYYGITYNRIKSKKGILWPCPSEEHEGTARLFEKKFMNSDEKAVMKVIGRNESRKEVVTEQFPLYLTTGRIMSHYLTGVQTRKTSALEARNFESFIEIHPSTAAQYGVEDQTLVKVRSERGEIVVRSKFSTAIRQDTVFVPFHWGEDQNVNMLIPEELDPICRIPGFKLGTVTITPIHSPLLN